MVGHAIDYRIRWWLAGVGHLPSVVIEGLALCAPTTQDSLLGAFAQVEGFPAGKLSTTQERALAQVAVAAATVEPLFRAGAVPCPLQEQGMERFLELYDDVVGDVLQITEGLPSLLEPLQGRSIHSGPIVAVGRLAGDADLLAGDELVEIKCTVKPRDIATDTVRQLLVYSARLRPAAASIVLPRQGCRVVFDLTSMERIFDRLDSKIVAAYS